VWHFKLPAFECALRTILAFTAAKLSKILKIESPLNWSTILETSDLLLAGHQIGEAELFAKIEDEEIQKQIEQTKTANKEDLRQY
jgi:methionyl-tRNA synthetase